MTNSNRTIQMIETLRRVADAAHSPDVPNGTTRKLQENIGAVVSGALDELYRIASIPEVPNGTTKRVLKIMEGTAEW